MIPDFGFDTGLNIALVFCCPFTSSPRLNSFGRDGTLECTTNFRVSASFLVRGRDGGRRETLFPALLIVRYTIFPPRSHIAVILLTEQKCITTTVKLVNALLPIHLGNTTPRQNRANNKEYLYGSDSDDIFIAFSAAFRVLQGGYCSQRESNIVPFSVA